MKTIIAGSRGINLSTDTLDKIIKASGIEVTEVVSGTCHGPDRLGEAWAREHGIPITQFPADWDTHGRSAGYKRNASMAEYADAAVILWDGRSKGAGFMIDLALERGLRVWIHQTITQGLRYPLLY